MYITEQLKALLGFSRILQATLSTSQPILAAVVALHGYPPLDRFLLGLSAAFAGFLAVFALNDLLDEGLDRGRFDHLRNFEGFDLDSALGRHPLATGRIGHRLGGLWIASLAGYALVAAWLLNPLSALLFLVAAGLHTIYCRLARVTHLRFILNGLMVGVGAMAGWAAMSQGFRPMDMGLLFAWMFTWEIGGRNIVNDFADVDEDTALGIRTVPVVWGATGAALLAFAFLVAAWGLGIALGVVTGLGSVFIASAVLIGLLLLGVPGWRLLRHPTPPVSLALFNRASFYPPAMLVALTVSLLLPV